jgi:hypothetical protein
MQGIEWVLDMYRSGECSDFRYVYDNQSPNHVELLAYLKDGQSRKKPPSTEQVSDFKLKMERVCRLPLTGRLVDR